MAYRSDLFLRRFIRSKGGRNDFVNRPAYMLNDYTGYLSA